MNDRKLALLYLIHLLVYSDGEYDESEKDAVLKICKLEGIDNSEYQDFHIKTMELSEREMFHKGIDHIEECSEDDKIAVFVWLYKLSEADGTVHAKEVRFLLYSLRRTNLSFDDVKHAASVSSASL